MKPDTELKHLINKSIYLIGGIIVACLGGFWIHDCNKYPSPPSAVYCNDTVEIITSSDNARQCRAGATISIQPIIGTFNFIYTCHCQQIIIK